MPLGKHSQLCGVGRVPNSESKFHDAQIWVHLDFDLLSQEFLTKPEREGFRSSASTLPAPSSKEARGASSSRALPSLAPISREVAVFKGLPLAGVKKKMKQR